MAKGKSVVRKIGYALFLVFVIIYLAPLVITLTNSFMSSVEVERNYSFSLGGNSDRNLGGSTDGNPDGSTDGNSDGSIDRNLDGGTDGNPDGGIDGNLDGRKDRNADGYIDMHVIPDKVTLSQYSRLLLDSPKYLNMFWNSAKIAVPIVLGQAIVSVLAAYAFTVLRFRGKEAVFFFYITVMLLPLQVTLMPNYIVADWLNIKDSYLAVILPAIFNPFGVFLLRQYLKSMPDSYIEAAQIDGAGHGRILWSVVLPMLRPGLAAVAMLTLLDDWNLVDQAVVFIQEAKKQPLSTFLAQIGSGEMGLAFAGSVFYAIPVLLVLFYGQEYLKDGIAITGIKG